MLQGLGTVPPKITCPFCRNIFPRTRLYEQLDELNEKPALWVSGPPGSGKTALVCSYLNQTGKTIIWYQIDAEDDDPATFFYYLARATEQGTGVPPQVPPFTAEYFQSPLNFTRWYFTRLCSSLSGPAFFVLDNFQELPGDSVLQPIIETIIANISPGIQLIIISRDQLPSSLTRAKLNGRIATLGWDKLRLTLAESKGILTMHSKVSSQKVELLHEKAAGWVAGLLLLEAGMKIVKTSALRVTDQAKEELFHYFAGEIFDRLNKKRRDFLLRTSLLPHMTASMAAELSGVNNGAEILLALTRRNYFVTSRPTREGIYQYHPMFRDFLLLQLQRQLPEEERKSLAEKAGILLQRSGDIEEAAQLFIQAESWPRLIELVLTNAATLCSEGRLRLLLDWLARIPEHIITATPWLLYWFGTCKTFLDPMHSMPLLEKAYQQFSEKKEIEGMLLSWAAIVNAILLRSGSFAPFQKWIDEFDHLEPCLNDQPLQIQAPVIVSMLYALGLASTDLDRFDSWVERAEWLVQQEIDVVTKAHTYNLLIVKTLFRGDLAGAEYYLSLFRIFDNSVQLPPFSRIQLKNCAAAFAWMSGLFEECEQEGHEGLDIAGFSGIALYNHYFWGQLVAGALSQDKTGRASGYLQEMVQCKDRIRPWEQSFYHVLSAWAALLEDNVAQARLHADTGIRLIDTMGTAVNNAHIYLSKALALNMARQATEAMDMLLVALDVARQARDTQTQYSCLLAGAWIALQGEEMRDSHDYLRQAMTLGRTKGYINGYFWNSRIMAELCRLALEQGMEENYVRRLIRKRSLMPEAPPATLENWPWKIRIYTLGRFSLLVDDVSVKFAKKAQSKPLELLLALIALGGRNVSQEKLADCLWPDALGDAAISSLSTTIQRLRKILTVHEAVIVHNNTVTLNPKLCWVDSWAFERSISQLLSAPGEKKKESLLRRAASLYHGPFLRELEDVYWTCPLRNRLADNFSRLAVAMMDIEQKEGENGERCHLLEKAFRFTPYDEKICRCLMRWYAASNRMNKVRQTYENCCQALSEQGGIKPSPQTKEVFNSLSR